MKINDKLEFNIYCIFKKDKKNIKEIIEMIFEDYIQKIGVEEHERRKN